MNSMSSRSTVEAVSILHGSNGLEVGFEVKFTSSRLAGVSTGLFS